MVDPLEGEEKSQLEQIFTSYYNFLQRKIIANSSDKVGLILYNVVTIHLDVEQYSEQHQSRTYLQSALARQRS